MYQGPTVPFKGGITMKRFLLANVVALGTAAVAWAADTPKKDQPPAQSKSAEKNVAKQLKAVETALNDKRQELLKQYQAAKEQAEKDKVIRQFRELNEAVNEQYVEIVRKHPEDP